MHIMEGYLPIAHAIGWSCASLPFLAVGIRRLQRLFREKPETKLFLSASGGFVFLLSAMKLPSVTGSCSHPTGIGLGATLFGPWIMTVLGASVLLFQALLLAHGGLTTLGANVFSMAIVGAFTAWGVFRGARAAKLSFAWALFLAAMLGDLATYVTTATQLALAFPDAAAGFLGAWMKFLTVFAVTQVPLAVSEGLLSVLVMNLLRANAGEAMQAAGLISGEVLP